MWTLGEMLNFIIAIAAMTLGIVGFLYIPGDLINTIPPSEFISYFLLHTVLPILILLSGVGVGASLLYNFLTSS